MNILKMRQALDLDMKIIFTKQRIREFYVKMFGKVYVSFSGGKDSTVLLHIVRSIYPDVPAVFVDTGLEYPEIREFVKTIDNVIWLKPEMNFREVLKRYGYPVVSKQVSMAINRYRNTKSETQKNLRLYGYDKKTGKSQTVGIIPKKFHYLIHSEFKISEKCCDIMKKRPFKNFYNETGMCAFVGTMAEESRMRRINYEQHGCNAYDLDIPQGRPLMIWKEKDVWDYIKKYNISYSKIYDMGERRTGCMFCMFGLLSENEPNRFQRMQKNHFQQWKYCMENLGIKEILKFMNVSYKNIQQELF